MLYALPMNFNVKAHCYQHCPNGQTRSASFWAQARALQAGWPPPVRIWSQAILACHTGLQRAIQVAARVATTLPPEPVWGPLQHNKFLTFYLHASVSISVMKQFDFTDRLHTLELHNLDGNKTWNWYLLNILRLYFYLFLSIVLKYTYFLVG